MKTNINNINIPLKAVLFVALICNTFATKAQLYPFQSMYFQNQYLYNPAMAGTENALRINVGHRQQWSSFPGTPKTSLLTADMRMLKNAGLGLNIVDDQAGLIRQTRVMGTYAYHLPLSAKNEHLNFGLSLGVNDAHVDYSKVTGDLSDEQIMQYNQLKAYIDGDLGIAYTSDKLTVSGALPNLKSVFFNSSDQRFDADRLLFILSASYKLDLSPGDNNFILEPLLAFRKVKGYKDIGDMGFNFEMPNYHIFLQSIYHTSQSMGLGVGFDQHTYLINFSYNLETGSLSNYTRGAFEFGLKLRLLEKK